MPDPWLEGDDLKKHEEEVANHPLTKEAEALKDQQDDLLKQVEERKQQYAEESGLGTDNPAQARPAAETGYSASVANADIGTSGEATPPPPAGNAESTIPTQEEQEAPKKASPKKS